jgi:anti-anti-sigma factor
MTDALTIQDRRERDCTIVTVTGDVDVTTVGELRKRLFELATSGVPVMADLTQVGFIDSAGLGVLAGTAKRATASGGFFHVVSDQPNLWQLAHLTGLDSQIPLVRTLEEARQALALRAPPP